MAEVGNCSAEAPEECSAEALGRAPCEAGLMPGATPAPRFRLLQCKSGVSIDTSTAMPLVGGDVMHARMYLMEGMRQSWNII